MEFQTCLVSVDFLHWIIESDARGNQPVCESVHFSIELNAGVFVIVPDHPDIPIPL